MANFPKLKLTNAGLELLANVQAGADTLTFTKTALGDGETDTPVAYITALVSPKIEVPVTEGKQVGTSSYQIGSYFSNKEVTVGFWWREVGVYAKGSDGKEILYCYSNAGNAGDYIPVGSDERVEKYIYQSLSIGNAENVTVEVDESDIFVLKKEFTEHTGAENPHGITAETIHLENVPNVATNDQTPTYTEAETLETLTSGEKLSVAFGKIKKAITDLIAHVSDKVNPHNVTKEQIGLGGVNVSSGGVAIGSGASEVGNGGVAVGVNAKVTTWAIQLGSGTNSSPNTLQVNGYQLMKADGTIPSERIKTINISVPKSWTANASGGYKQTINVSGILATDNPVVDIVLGDDVEANKLYIKAWECIGSITTASGSITLYAYGDAPATAFTIKLKVV